MRGMLGVLLMEEENGEIVVQLFSDPEKAMASFENWAGRVNQAPQRATFLNIDYGAKGVKMTVKELPSLALLEKLDGYRLGEGPVKIETEEVQGDLPRVLGEIGKRDDGEVDTTKTRRD